MHFNADLKCAARGSLEIQDAKMTQNRHLGTIAQLCRAAGWIFATKECIDNRKKNLLNSNISSACPHNMANFDSLAAEIGSGVWGTPANFNRFRILAVLLYATLVVGIGQTLRRWTEGARATYIWQGGHHVGHWATF